MRLSRRSFFMLTLSRSLRCHPYSFVLFGLHYFYYFIPKSFYTIRPMAEIPIEGAVLSFCWDL